MAHYRPTKHTDIVELAPNLRQIDQEEIKAMTGEAPYEGLFMSWVCSTECNSIINDEGAVVGIFGVASHGPYGVPWLLGSSGISEIAKEFLQGAEEWVRETQPKYKLLVNYVLEKNTVAVRWLKSLGFVMLSRQKVGHEGAVFIEFVRARDV